MEDTPTTFLSLPAELRTMIYKLAINEHEKCTLVKRNQTILCKFDSATSLLATSKQIRTEVMSMLMWTITFHIRGKLQEVNFILGIWLNDHGLGFVKKVNLDVTVDLHKYCYGGKEWHKHDRILRFRKWQQMYAVERESTPFGGGCSPASEFTVADETIWNWLGMLERRGVAMREDKKASSLYGISWGETVREFRQKRGEL